MGQPNEQSTPRAGSRRSIRTHGSRTIALRRLPAGLISNWLSRGRTMNFGLRFLVRLRADPPYGSPQPDSWELP